jgi:hypothetical protein
VIGLSLGSSRADRLGAPKMLFCVRVPLFDTNSRFVRNFYSKFISTKPLRDRDEYVAYLHSIVTTTPTVGVLKGRSVSGVILLR